MEKITIETTQNVVIEHNIASVGERILATILDYLFFFAYIMIAIYVFDVFSVTSGALGILFFLPLILYHLVCEIVFNGQSLGKMIMKIKVVRLDGSPVSLGSYFLRWIFRLVDVMLFYGIVAIITVLVNGRGQRLGDLAAGTTVVRLRAKATLSDTILAELPQDYQLHFPEVSKLEESDINTVHQVIKHLQKNRSHPALMLSYKAKNALQRKMGIESDLQPYEFFETILRDYNYLNMNQEV